LPKHSRSKHNALFVRRGGSPRHGKGKPPVSKDGNRMNKTEARYAAHLQAQCEAQEIGAWWYEPISWRVAESSHYKPDFLVQYGDGSLEVHECKATRGREWASTPEAWLKLKVVAEQMPWRVCVVWQTKDGVWHRDYVGER
jgi:hypothetical protein